MRSNNILIRADSSSTIGTGHIMRDLVLAKRYPQDNIIFAAQNLKGNINHKITESGYTVELLQSNDIQELDKLIKKLCIDMLIIDHYGIDESQEKQLKHKNATLKIMVLDDTYEKHYCDILLNHNISANKKKYKTLVPSDCEIRCGTQYTLLREEFYKEKKKYQKQSTSTSQIFLAMGGADTAHLNIPILQILSFWRKKWIKVNVVTTSANKNLQQLRLFCRNKKWIELHINSNRLAKLMAKSDLAIVTPSVTLNEVYFMKLPLIAIKVASNQEDMYRFLKQHRHCVLKRFHRKKFTYFLKRFL